MRQFEDVITTEAELRDVMGFPADRVQRKVISAIDKHCAKFISLSPFPSDSDR